MASPKRRSLQSHLPARHRTESLSKLFAASVDHLFQPGSAEPLSGFIGQKPDYYDAATDFYLPEPTPARQAYQLDAAMVSTDRTGAVTHALFYDDLLHYLRGQGASVEDQNRLFASDFYAWAPPVDIDKLNNPLQYYWFGDRINQPAVELTAPALRHTADGSTRAYALPDARVDIPPDRERLVVLVRPAVDGAGDGPAAAVAATRSGDTALLAAAPPAGATVEVFRYGDLTAVIEGRSVFDLDGLTAQPVASLTTGMLVRLVDGLTLTGGWSTRAWERSDAAGLDVPWDVAAPQYYSVEGVGDRIRLLPVDPYVADTDATPRYVVMARGCRDGNPWSRANHWVHHDAVAWAGPVGAARQAARPIIEFARDMQLFNYGGNRLDDVDAVESGDLAISLGWDEFALGEEPLDTPHRALELRDISGQIAGTLTVDGLRPLRGGERLLVRHPEPSPLNNRIYRVAAAKRPVGATSIDVLVLTPEGPPPSHGDMVRTATGGWVPFATPGYARTPYDYDGRFKEYWFDGARWLEAQPFSGDPLFDLFDGDGVGLADPGRYPGSDFAGSRVFAYAAGGVADRVLGTGIAHDRYGQIVFEAVNASVRHRDRTGAIPGYYYHRINGATPRYKTNWHLADGTTRQALENGVHAIPLPLQANPDHQEVTTVSRNAWFGHLSNLVQAQDGFTGTPFGANNWRDTAQALNRGTDILQHRLPLLKTMLLASDGRFDYPAALRFVEHEYARYRAKFLQKIMEFRASGACTDEDPPEVWADAAMDALTVGKTADFPFAHSPMAGGGRFLPATPSALGLLPTVTPALVVDTSYGAPLTLLRGHDGSLSPTFGDIRDAALLALETRIHAALPDRFKGEAAPPLALAARLPGKHRPDACDRAAFATMLTPMLERWSQVTGVSLRDHAGFDPSDPFTWNYGRCTDRDGAPLPGHWRGIYRHCFDTDQPHAKPWEMLGFTEQPGWWEAAYGPAPYTRGNTALWADLEAGRIQGGPRAGVDAAYARPGLSEILPVDDYGGLLDPVAARIVAQAPTHQQAGRPWQIGDHAPAETLWMNSPSYRFALALAAFLMAPTRVVEIGWNTLTHTLVHGEQWVDAATGRRTRAADLRVHGETDASGATVVAHGVQQWLVDRLAARGQAPSVLGDAVRGLGVRLGHKMAGYVNPDNLRILSDNFGLVPAEDVTVLLHRSPSTREEFYSGVVLEWTGTGWRAIGYNPSDPVFTVAPPDINGPKGVISLSDAPEPVIVPWRPNTHYAAGTLAAHDGSTYRCLRAHTSARRFEQGFWEAAGGLDAFAPRVVNYLRGDGTTRRVPYGTEFATFQDVADFLLGHGRHLRARGWEFEDADPDTGVVRDWSAAIRDFLEWAQLDWQPGNFIALSPGAEHVRYSTGFGMILDLEDATTGVPGLFDRSGRPIAMRNAFVSRLDGAVDVRAGQGAIFGARVRIGEVEHALLFSNTTIFADVIYDPLFNLRQPRLRLLGQRTAEWAGRFDAPGHVIDGNTLVENFETAAESLRTMFDIEGAANPTLRDHARHVVGYESRDYMDSLLLSETTQFEFHQGMIQQKGAPGVFDKLLRSHFIKQSRDIRFHEEWAVLAGEYGGVRAQRRLALRLRQSDMRTSPQLVRLRDAGVVEDGGDLRLDVPLDSPLWVEAPSGTAVFPLRGHWEPGAADPPNPGYVRLGETQHAVFHLDDLPPYLDDLAGAGATVATGDRVWIYDTGAANDDTHDDWFGRRFDSAPFDHAARTQRGNAWTVLRVCELQPGGIGPRNRVQRIDTPDEIATLKGASQIYFRDPHGLTAGDAGLHLLLDGDTRTEPALRGLHRIDRVLGDIAVQVTPAAKDGVRFSDDDSTVFGDWTDASADAAPQARVLRPVRYATRAQAEADTSMPRSEGDLAYVDDDGAGAWTVLRWTHPYDGFELWAFDEQAFDEIRYDSFGREFDVPPFDMVPGWTEHRRQPRKVDGARVRNARLYDRDTRLDGATMTPNPVILPRLDLYDPAAGLLPGTAMREIDFKVEYDPASYDGDAWGAGQVGRVWWDLSAVRFLVAETDAPTTEERRAAEEEYRVAQWGRIAPKTAIAVYEWVRSDAPPSQWAADGAVRDAAPCVQAVEYDADADRMVTAYYFWVRGRSVVPGVGFRKVAAASIAAMLENPAAGDRPWFAPVFPDAFLVSGIDAALNDGSTVLQIDLRTRDTEAVPHAQWTLLRPGDPRSLPSDTLWRKLRDSLAGFDDDLQPVPDRALPQAQRGGVAVRPRQGMFATTDAEPRALEARRAFVEALNRLFAASSVAVERPGLIEALSRAGTPAAEDAWSAGSGRTHAPLPQGDWDHRVTSLAERDRLLVALAADPAARARGAPLRVLLDNRAADTPHWSVWEVTAADIALDAGVTVAAQADAILAQAETLFSLARVYDRTVASRAERDLLNAPSGVPVGMRVLVEADEQADGFWTVSRYDPDDVTNADAAGWVPVRWQTERLRDCWEYADWYAEGHDAGHPPRLRYPTPTARDLALVKPGGGDSAPVDPDRTFVRIDDDGTGAWVWTVYDDARPGWVTVARQNGTIRLTGTFHDASRPVVGLTAASLAAAAGRDGSFEMRALVDGLRDALTAAEVNELFFTMLHFVHATQDEVAWAFKTSFLSVAGYNEPLVQSPVQRPDNMENLIKYIEEVKPYRVKLRAFVRSLTPALDAAPVTALDFDKPPYYDAAAGSWRRLDDTSIQDRAILDGAGSYAAWRAVQAQPDSPVRALNLRLAFDRVSVRPAEGFDLGPYGGMDGVVNPAALPGMTALERILAFYEPLPGMRAKDPETLMALGLRNASLIDGADLGDHRAVGFVPSAAFDGAEFGLYGLSGGGTHDTNIPGLARLWWNGRSFYEPYADKRKAGDPRLESQRRLQDGGAIAPPPGGETSQWDVLGSDLDAWDTPLLSGRDLDLDGNGTAATAEVAVNSDVQDAAGYGLSAPHHERGHPEELAPLTGEDSLVLTVTSGWATGAPNQSVKLFDVTRDKGERAMLVAAGEAFGNAFDALPFSVPASWTGEAPDPAQPLAVTLPLSVVPQTAEAVAVYLDGVRLEPADYAVDLFGRAVALTVPGTARRVLVHAFATSAMTPLRERHCYGNTGTRYPLAAPPVDAEVVASAGRRLAALVTGTADGGAAVILAMPPAGPDVAVTVAEHGSDFGAFAWGGGSWGTGRRATPVHTRVEREALAWTAGQSWRLANPSGPTLPEHAATVVEVNGLRLAPPDTHNKTITPQDRVIALNRVPSSAAVLRFYVNGTEHAETPLMGFWPDLHSVLADTAGDTLFALWRDRVVVRRPKWTADIVVTVTEGHDYTVEDGRLTIVRPLDPGDRIAATTFVNNALMGIRTHSFSGSRDGEHWFDTFPDSEDHIWLTVDGRRLVGGVDFSVRRADDHYDESAFDTMPVEQDGTGLMLTLPYHLTADQRVVATVFTGRPAREDMRWTQSTAKPSPARTVPDLSGSDFDWVALDTAPLENRAWPKTADTPLGPRVLHRDNAGWEHTLHLPARAGVLLAGVEDDSPTIAVDFPQAVSAKLLPEHRLAVPAPDRPGVVWIGGERIEYFDLARDGTVHTLGQLRRGTRGTRMAPERRLVARHPPNGTRYTLTGARNAPVEVVLVRGDGHRLPLQRDLDYALRFDGDGVTVLLRSPPDPATGFVALAQTLGSGHPAGSAVLDGRGADTRDVTGWTRPAHKVGAYLSK